MSRTVLGIVKLAGSPEQPCAFKRACEKARVSFKCEAVSTLQQGIAYLSGAGEYSDRRRYPVPALVILDGKLDDDGGLQALLWIRSQPAFRYLPVVMVSESKSQLEMKRAYDRGASSYLLKPRSFAGLVELIKVIDRYWLTLNQTPAP